MNTKAKVPVAPDQAAAIRQAIQHMNVLNAKLEGAKAAADAAFRAVDHLQKELDGAQQINVLYLSGLLKPAGLTIEEFANGYGVAEEEGQLFLKAQ